MPADAITVTLDAGQVVAAVVGLAALLGAFGYLIKRAREALRVIHALERMVVRELASEDDGTVKGLVKRELTHNHGSSMKDDLTGLTVGFRAMSRQVDQLDERQGAVENDVTHLRREFQAHINRSGSPQP